uniref:Uncharacterized protein n=1 Tax=Cannabis sativa TaxID=3483 RepID=A0A803PVT5_CANSA
MVPDLLQACVVNGRRLYDDPTEVVDPRTTLSEGENLDNTTLPASGVPSVANSAILEVSLDVQLDGTQPPKDSVQP